MYSLMTLVAYVVLGSGDLWGSLIVKESPRRTLVPLLLDMTKFHLRNLLMVISRLVLVNLMDTAGKITSVAYYC